MTHSKTQKSALGGRCRRTSDEIAAILKEYSASDLSQRDFAHQAGVGCSTLQYWLRRAREGVQLGARRWVKNKPQPPSLIEVELEGDLRMGSLEARYELELANGMRLRMASAFDDQDVRRLLSLMKEVR